MKTPHSFGQLAVWIIVAYLASATPASLQAMQPTVSNTLGGPSAGVTSVVFSPDGKMLATAGAAGSTAGGFEHTITLWDTKTWKKLAVNYHLGNVTALAVNPDGSTLASASLDKTIKLWDLATLTNTATFAGHDFGFYSLAFSPDGRTIVAGDNGGTVVTWEVPTGRQRTTVPWPNKNSGRLKAVQSLAFSPNGRILAEAGGDTTIRLLESANYKEIATLEAGHKLSVISLAFSPNGKLLASGGADANLKGQGGKQPRPIAILADLTQTQALPASDVDIWDVATRKKITSLKGHSYFVRSVVFSPDGRMLASASGDNTIKLWEVLTGKNRATLTGHSKVVSSVAFSPDGKTLASGSADGTIKLWDLPPTKGK